MIFPSIKARVLLLAVIPTTAASIIFFSYFVTKQNSDIESSLTEKGNDIALQLAHASEYGIFSGNLSLLTSLVDSAYKESNVASITITDDKGKTLIQRPATQPPAPTNKKIIADNHVFSKPITQTPISISDFDEMDEALPSIIGWVIIEISNDLSMQRKWEAMIETLFITLAILASSIYLGTTISRRITFPIITLTNAVKEIEHGNLNIPISTYATGELLSLERGIRGMLRSIKTSHHDSQQKIEKATIELRESLELLEHKNYDLTVARQEALSASQAKSSFLANISHEIRTPMNGILGFVRLLNNTPLSSEQAEYLHTIEQSAHNLLRIINDVLDLSKVEAGKLTISKMPFNLRECIEEVMILVSPSVHEKGLEIATLFYDDTPESLIGPQDRVRQILINLIGNAIKFSDKGMITIRAMIEKKANESAIIKISVSDQGPGISEKNQQMLFNSFTQIDESNTRQHSGVGLGLSISKSLAKAMNGDIGVESRINEGSTFWFTFECSLPENENTLIEKGKPFDGKSVKIYDSNELSLLCISHSFTKLGFTVQEYVSIDELNNSLGKIEKTDIITYNLSVNETRNINTTFNDRGFFHTDKSLVIINSSEDDTLATLRTYGIKHYLARPFRTADLIGELTSITSLTENIDNPDIPDASPFKESAQPSAQRRLDGFTILVAEDNPINAKFIATILKRSGAETVIVGNGQLAIDEFSARKFDVILMDIHMPVMDGVVATQKIRALEKNGQRTPILGLTAINIDNNKPKYKNAGLDDVLEKPVAVDELLHEIAYHVHSNELQTSFHPPVITTTNNKKNSSRLGLDKNLFSTMYEMLLAELPKTKKILTEAYAEKDWITLRNEIHRFLGGMSYCDVPDLQILTIAFQKSLKLQDGNLDDKFDAMLKKIDALIPDQSIH